MSRVFVAYDETLERRVVVKVLAPELMADVNAERFRREVTDLLEQDTGDRDQVYCLELAFFPVADLTTMES